MTYTVTQATREAIMGQSTSSLTLTAGLVLTGLLIALLVEREIIQGMRSPSSDMVVRMLDVLIAPLGAVFVVVIVVRFLLILGRLD